MGNTIDSSRSRSSLSAASGSRRHVQPPRIVSTEDPLAITLPHGASRAPGQAGAALAAALAAADVPTRARAVRQLQTRQGNIAVQRMAGPVARATEEEEEKLKPLGLAGTGLDTVKGALEGGTKLLEKGKGLAAGFGMEGVAEALSRGGKGEGLAQAAGGGALKMAVNALLGTEGAEQALKGATGAKTLGSAGGVAGGALKLAGGLMGEKEGPDIGLSDIGEYYDVASKLVNPKELVTSTVKEGVGALWTTGTNIAKSVASGSGSPLIEQGESQLKSSGSPIQGYQMLANLAGAAASGEGKKELNRIGDLADAGKLGALPKLGSKLGDQMFKAIGPKLGLWLADKLGI